MAYVPFAFDFFRKMTSYAAAKKSVVVTNQKQLEKALKNGATNIVIKTNKNVKTTIPATKKAAKASISVQAKNATITNKASVKSIVIKDAKAFVESGKNNDIKITDSKLSLTVAKESKGADIRVAKKDAEIKVVAKGHVASVTVAKTADVILTVNKTATVDSVNVVAKGASVDLNAKGTVSDVKVSEKAADTKLNINASGKVENVQIDAKADVAVAGSTTEAVKVTVNAKDTTIKAETAVETTLNADAKVDLSKGAEGSKVTTAENVKVDVANNTEDKVIVTDSTGKETSVDAGKTETTKDESKKDDEKKDDQKKDDQSSGGSSGGSSGTVTPTPTPSEPKNPDIVGATKTSIVVNPIVGLEYTYVKSGEKISEDAKWYGYDDYDDHDHIIFDKLDTTSYDVYYRMAASPSHISEATVVDLTQKHASFAVITDSNEEYAENACYNWEKGQLVVDVFINPDVVVYDQNGFVEEYDYSIDDKNSESVADWSAEADGDGIMISFVVADTCQANQNYTFNFDFNVMTGEDSDVIIGSKNYKVTFKIPQKEWDEKDATSDAAIVDTWVDGEMKLYYDLTIRFQVTFQHLMW